MCNVDLSVSVFVTVYIYSQSHLVHNVPDPVSLEISSTVSALGNPILNNSLQLIKGTRVF